MSTREGSFTAACLAATVATAWTAGDAVASPYGQFDYSEPATVIVGGTAELSKPLSNVYLLFTTNSCGGLPAEPAKTIKLDDGLFGAAGTASFSVAIDTIVGHRDTGVGPEASHGAFTLIGLYDAGDDADHLAITMNPFRAEQQIDANRTWDQLYGGLSFGAYNEATMIAALKDNNTAKLAEFAESPMQFIATTATTYYFGQPATPITEPSTLVHFSTATNGGTVSFTVVPEPGTLWCLPAAAALLFSRRRRRRAVASN